MNANEAEEYYLSIFLSHGKSPLWQEVANYIEQKLAHEVVEFTDALNQGRTAAATSMLTASASRWLRVIQI